MPRPRQDFDYARYKTLKAQGLSSRAIAKAMGVPEATLRYYTKPLTQRKVAKSTLEDTQLLPDNQKVVEPIATDESAPDVDNGGLEGLLAWWRHRQEVRQEPKEGSLVRWTVHVSERWLQAIRRESDLTGDTYTAIANRALRQYFTGQGR
jgi:hypothetical protein